MTKDNRPQPEFFLEGSRGQYLARDFANLLHKNKDHVRNVTDEQWDILRKGPGDEQYLDAWDEVLRDAVIVGTNGVEYTLSEEEGDLFIVPVGMEWSDDEAAFIWP